MSFNMKSIRDKINKQETELPDVNSMTKEEILDYVLSSFQKYYKAADIKNQARYSTCKDFYQGVGRGFWECERVVTEIRGRLKNDCNRNQAESDTEEVQQVQV